jgi:hypothetical protein
MSFSNAPNSSTTESKDLERVKVPEKASKRLVLKMINSLKKDSSKQMNEVKNLIQDLSCAYAHDKARAHKGGMKIGKTPKKLASICCPQHRETNADTLKATEANRRREPGTREKVSLRRINLEGNTQVQESNVSQLPV